MRLTKYRAWHKEEKIMSDPFSIFEITDGFIDFGQFIYGYEDDVVLLQFTGLKDKKGKEIYEGDIINAFHYDGISKKPVTIDYKIVVGWSKKYVGFSIPCTRIEDWYFEYEVIGNIMENPELLKGGEKYDRKRQIKKTS